MMFQLKVRHVSLTVILSAHWLATAVMLAFSLMFMTVTHDAIRLSYLMELAC